MSSLGIGSLTLSPVFKPEVKSYTSTTQNKSDVINVTSYNTRANITILVNSSPVINGGSITWNEGENTVTITVRYGADENVYTVVVTKTTPDTSLSSLSIGSLTLTPVFSKEVKSYTTQTTNASNVIKAEAADESAQIKITSSESAVNNNEAITWNSGLNEVKIVVTKNQYSTEYTVNVTKNEAKRTVKKTNLKEDKKDE